MSDTPQTPTPTPGTGQNIELTIGFVSYLTIIGWLVAYFGMDQTKKTATDTYHLRQSLGVHIGFIALQVIGQIIFVGPYSRYYGSGQIVNAAIQIVYVVLIALAIIGAINAYKKEQKELPFVGAKFAQWFRNIK